MSAGKINTLLLVVSLAVAGSLLFAQDSAQSPPAAGQNQQIRVTKNGDLSVTGCLKTGDQGGEYSVVGQDGKKYGLWGSGKVKLDEHVGQVVTVTGRQKGPTKGDPDESAAITVTSVKRISDNCP
jgi:hypothetical protein